jgi:anti-sigma regulatory factor (Ser/Thr protein kinase)
MKELSIDANIENLDAVLAFIESELEATNFPAELQQRISIAVEEIFMNIANYAYSPEVGGVAIRISIGDGVTIEFEDKGKPYNPLERKNPNMNIPLEDREIGGLGIFMVKQMMDSVKYEYTEGKNIFTIMKTAPEP